MDPPRPFRSVSFVAAGKQIGFSEELEVGEVRGDHGKLLLIEAEESMGLAVTHTPCCGCR